MDILWESWDMNRFWTGGHGYTDGNLGHLYTVGRLHMAILWERWNMDILS